MRPTDRRRHPSSTSPAASQRPGALDAARRRAHGRALPRVAAMLAGPRLHRLVGQHLGTQALQQRRFRKWRSRGDLSRQPVVLLGVGRQARGVQQFVRVDVVHHALILGQIRMQLDGDWPWIEAKVTGAHEVGRLGLKARQAEVDVIALRPAQGDAFGHPRQEDALRRGRGGA